jgi:hypothetical protein
MGLAMKAGLAIMGGSSLCFILINQSINSMGYELGF